MYITLMTLAGIYERRCVMPDNMRQTLEVENIVMDALLDYGYPRNSIVMEGKLDARRFVDFVVTDLDTGLPMMIIEVKSGGERTLDSVKQMAFCELKRYYDKYNLPIKTVAAILNRVDKKLEFVDFTEAVKENNYDRLVENYALPPYEILTIGARQKAVDKQKTKQEKNIAALKWLCWLVCPLICLTLVLLDAINIYSLSVLRLITIGSGVAITLIPCFKEIRIGEIHIKNALDRAKDDKE